MARSPIELKGPGVRRMVLVRFKRAGGAGPRADYPDVDDRAYTSAAPGAVVGVAAGHTVTVLLERTNISDAATLSVVSDSAAVKVVGPADAGTKLPGGNTVELRLEAPKFDKEPSPKVARIQVRYHPAVGDPVVIAELQAWVYEVHRLKVALHRVGVHVVKEDKHIPVALKGLAGLMAAVNAIWLQCGIQFDVASDDAFEIEGFASGVPAQNDRFNKLIERRFLGGHINLYFVPRLRAGVDVVGVGKDKDDVASGEMKHRGLFFAETRGQQADAVPIGPDELAHVLAHELGHYLGLSHPHDEPDVEELFSRRSLMHNATNLSGLDFMRTIGYGDGKPGFLIPFKHLPGARGKDIDKNYADVARQTVTEGAYDTAPPPSEPSR